MRTFRELRCASAAGVAREQTRELIAEADSFVTNVQLGAKLGVDRKTPGAFAYALGDHVGAFLARLLHSNG